MIIWVLSFSEDTLGRWACWSQGSCSREEINISSFNFWGKEGIFWGLKINYFVSKLVGYKHVFLCILIAHYLPTQKIPKTSGSQSVSVKVAWVLPVFHRHKNFCLWAEIKASTSNEQYLPFIRAHFPNLTQITTSAELAWKPFCWMFQRRAKVQHGRWQQPGRWQ